MGYNKALVNKIAKREKKRASKSMSKPKVPSTVKSYVKRTMSRALETKIVSTSYSAAFNSAINTVGDNVTILPACTQGVGQVNRIGAAVTPVKLVIRGYIVYKTDSYTNALLLGGRLFCYKDRSVSNYVTGTNAGANFTLLDAGGTSVTFDGTNARYQFPHNSDEFVFFKDMKFRMLKPWGLASGAQGSTVGTAITSMNNTLYKPFTITLSGKDLPSTLKYDNTLSVNYPTNFAPYMALGYCDLLGYAPDVLPTQMIMTFTSTLYFKDA